MTYDLSLSNIRENIKKYLQSYFGRHIEVNYVGDINGDQDQNEDIKDFGYGNSVLVRFSQDGQEKEYILASMKKNTFGHDFCYDRAKTLLMDYKLFNKMPKHVNATDVGVFTPKKEFFSIGYCQEFYILREKADGREYSQDLFRIAEKRSTTDQDIERLHALVDYLVEIHAKKHNNIPLYRRRIRELIGHGECIMGLNDNYPEELSFTNLKELEEIEKKCIEWRYKLRNYSKRLCQVHGDYHPWNILFREGTDFTVLDRSRGEWGEPADDVSSMSLNYLFFSLDCCGKVEPVFLDMFETFWKRYLKKTKDKEMLKVVAPFFAWRCLVLASPLWYPKLDDSIRRSLFNFIHNVLDQEEFNPYNVNELLKGEF